MELQPLLLKSGFLKFIFISVLLGNGNEKKVGHILNNSIDSHTKSQSGDARASALSCHSQIYKGKKERKNNAERTLDVR